MYHVKRTTELNIATKKAIWDHIIKSKSDVYRLHFVRYATEEEKNKEFVSWDYVPFRMPSGMERSELFALLSYLRDEVSDKYSVRESSNECLSMLDSLIDKMKFERVPNATDVIPLFVVEGDRKSFNKGTFGKQFHRWYTPKVEVDTASKICQKLNIVLPNVK